jgi:hypothetical protein
MGSHLVFDSIGGGLMWLWPISTEVHAILPMGSLAGLTVVNVFLLVLPLYSIWERWKATGESPLQAFEWVSGYIPRPVTWGGVSIFGLMAVLVVGHAPHSWRAHLPPFTW